MDKATVYVVQGWEGVDDFNAILEQVKKKCGDNQNEFICIGSSCLPGTDTAASLTAYLINVYRTQGGLRASRTTILSAEDEMLGLQLCLADINLQVTGEFDALVSDVLTEINCVAERKLGLTEKEENSESKELEIPDSLAKDEKKVFEKYQTFLEHSFYVDLYDLLNFYKNQCSSSNEEVKYLNDKSFILFDLPVNMVENAMFSFLCSTRDVMSINVKGSSLGDDEEVDVKFESVTCPSDLLKPQSYSQSHPKTPKTKQSKLSPTQRYIQQIFLSYIDLLVNSNSSISLARVINIPDREIDHHAFTVLKRRASKSNLSMYQLAISLVMKIRLGGKGYAPDQNDPLMMYVKGLSLFVNFLQSLHTIIEDEPDVRLACRKVVKLIKNSIMKSRESLSRKPAVEEMAEKVQENIKDVYDEMEPRLQNKTTLPANRGGSMCGSKTLRVLQAVLDQHIIKTTGAGDTSVLSDVFLTQGTPIRFPSLLSQFRSPESVESPEKIQPLSKRIMNKQTEAKYKSCMSWVAPTINEHIPVTDIQYVLPSKTLVCPASGKKIYTDFSENEKENIPSNIPTLTNDSQENKEDNQNNEVKVKGLKEKETRKRKPTVMKSTLPKKKCCKKLLPQIKGQTTLNFFMKK